MTAARPYRQPLSLARAYDELMLGAASSSTRRASRRCSRISVWTPAPASHAASGPDRELELASVRTAAIWRAFCLSPVHVRFWFLCDSFRLRLFCFQRSSAWLQHVGVWFRPPVRFPPSSWPSLRRRVPSPSWLPLRRRVPSLLGFGFGELFFFFTRAAASCSACLALASTLLALASALFVRASAASSLFLASISSSNSRFLAVSAASSFFCAAASSLSSLPSIDEALGSEVVSLRVAPSEARPPQPASAEAPVTATRHASEVPARRLVLTGSPSRQRYQPG